MLRATFIACTTFFVAATFLDSVVGDCTFNVTDLPKTHRAPMVLSPGSTANAYSYYQPNAQGEVRLQRGDKITFACPGNANVLSPGGQGQPVIESSCGTNNIITGVQDVKILGCSRDVLARTAQVTTACGNRGKQVEVLLDVPNRLPQKRGSVKLYSLCFEGNLRIPSYSRHGILGSVSGLRYGDRPLFRAGTVPDLTTAYQQSTAYLERYLRTRNYTQSNSLTKGHLVPRADFPYASQQDATFFYDNTAPQWETINSGNWATIEAAVRRVALTRRRLQVATGTWGVAQVRDANRIMVNLYLNGDTTVPVPALFWKILYDPHTQQGVAFFGSNNPFITLQTLSPNVPAPCPNSVCRQLTAWLRFNPFNTIIGEVICCEIKDINPQLNLRNLPPATSLLINP